MFSECFCESIIPSSLTIAIHAVTNYEGWLIIQPTDPAIDRRGGGEAPIFKILYTHHSWHSYALEGSGKFWNLRPQMTHSRPYFGRNMAVFLFWGPRTGGGGAPAVTPSGSASGCHPKPNSGNCLLNVGYVRCCLRKFDGSLTWVSARESGLKWND